MSLITLYHFTNREALTDIVLDGEIRPSDKSLDREGDDVWPAHDAPDIVWLTTDPTPHWCCERRRSGFEPYAVRFTLHLPAEEVSDLFTWATHNKVYPDQATLRAVRDESRNFRCIERPVMAHAEWMAIDDMHRDGLCPGPRWVKYDTPEYRARYAERLAAQPAMTPLEVAGALMALACLRDALRDDIRRTWGELAPRKEAQ